MKKILFLVLLLGCAITVLAQRPRKPEFRPDWTYRTPSPENATYLYVVEHGEGLSQREAMNQAIARVFQSTANRIGQFVSTEEINRSLQSGASYNVIGRNIKVPINKVCEHSIQDKKTGEWSIYILCQVAKAGNITPEFGNFDGCSAHTLFDKQMGYYKEKLEEYVNDSIAKAEKDAKELKKKENAPNVKSLVSSIFVPGLGQILKGHALEGSLTMVGSIGCLAVGIGTYASGKKQLEFIKENKLGINEFKSAKKKYKSLQATSYIFYSLSGIIYAFNLYRSWTIETKKYSSFYYSFYPTVIPSENDLALGVGMSVNF